MARKDTDSQQAAEAFMENAGERYGKQGDAALTLRHVRPACKDESGGAVT